MLWSGMEWTDGHALEAGFQSAADLFLCIIRHQDGILSADMDGQVVGEDPPDLFRSDFPLRQWHPVNDRRNRATDDRRNGAT